MIKKEIINFYSKRMGFSVDYSICDSIRDVLQISYFEDEDLSTEAHSIVRFEFKNKLVSKYNLKFDFKKLTCEELKFLDVFDLEISKDCSKIIHQDLQSWWKNECEDENQINNNNRIKRTGEIPESLLKFLTVFVNDETGDPIKFKDWVDQLAKDEGLLEEDYSEAMTSDVKYDFKRKGYSYVPSRKLIISIVISLGLKGQIAEEFIHKTGYHLSKNIEFDRIILEAISRNMGIDETNKRLLEEIDEDTESNNPTAKYKYYKDLLGSKKRIEDARKSLK